MAENGRASIGEKPSDKVTDEVTGETDPNAYCVIMRTCVTMAIRICFLLLLAQFIYKISYKDQVAIDKDTLPSYTVCTSIIDNE